MGQFENLKQTFCNIEGQFDLEGLTHLRCLENHKFEMVHLFKVKTKMRKFEYHFDLKGQGKQFLNPSDTFRCLKVTF